MRAPRPVDRVKTDGTQFEWKGQVMAKAAKAVKHPRSGTRQLIDDMLMQRTRMLKLLCELSQQDLKQEQADDAVRETLDDFLTVLVDYIAAGHFGLYERIAMGSERRAPVVKTAREIYPRIADTTVAAVEFNERYGSADAPTRAQRLARDLSTLGEEVTTRIELEDRLIHAMLGTEYAIPQAATAH